MRFALAAVLTAAIASTCPAVDVVVDPSIQHQTIDGFGTCLISWDDNMARYYQNPDVAQAYAGDMKFNILRCNLWGDGTIGPTQDPDKISYKDPAFAKGDPRTPVFIAFAKSAMKHNPALKVVGTVWSPPAWMKENGSITDKGGSGAISGDGYEGERNGQKSALNNRVKPEFYPHFARWLVEMVKHYEANGVPIYAISPANEPGFTQGFESCLWSPKDLATITGMVGDLLEKEGLSRVKLFAPEHMTGFNWEGGPNRKYAQAFRDNPDALKHLDIVATHGYADGVTPDMSQNASAQFYEIFKDLQKPIWVTEGGTAGHDWPEVMGEKGVAAGVHNALVAGNVSAWVPWQFVEDSRSEHNLLPMKGPSKKTNVVRQFSAFIPAGSHRIEATPAYGEVNVSAFSWTGGSGISPEYTIVVINPSEVDKPVDLSFGKAPAPAKLNVVRTDQKDSFATMPVLRVTGGKASLVLPGRSITTLTTLP